MNVVYASDDNFVDILGISMISLFENNKDENICVYILADNIKSENKVILKNIAIRYYQNVEIIDVDVDDFSQIKLYVLTWSKAAFSRMFLGTILEKYELDRVIYLDCDIIINHNIHELWTFDLNKNTFGMVIDPIGAGHKRNVGISADKPYFNSGVLLINLKKWKQNDCENKLQQFAVQNNGKTPYVDQGLINGALKDYMGVLPLKFNVITVYCDYTYKELLTYRKPTGYFYSEDEVKVAVKNPYIIHYTKSMFTERPWIVNSNHKKKELWERYKGISPWRDKQSLPSTVNVYRKKYINISKKLPRKLNVYLQAILHSYIKPIVDRR